MFLSSFTDGLPNIILEAMACGTLVLATLVGSIADFLADTTDGFIMKDDSPNCIADGIVCALNYPEKELIASNERAVIIHGLRSTLLYVNGEKNFLRINGQ